MTYPKIESVISSSFPGVWVVERIVAEMAFGTLVATVNLDDIAQALERVERQADR